jgi:hypothetical protein
MEDLKAPVGCQGGDCGGHLARAAVIEQAHFYITEAEKLEAGVG